MTMKNKFPLILVLFVLISSLHLYADEIHDAAKKGDKAGVKAVLDRGADVNQKNSKGFTPLCIAIFDKNVEMFRFLLSRGADINIAPEGKTTLCLAAESGSGEIAGELLARGMSTKPLKQPASSDFFT